MKFDTDLRESGVTRKVKLLLAEDDEINQEIVRSLIAMRGDADLVVVGDGRAALEQAMVQKFDLMIFDRQMPHLTGDRVIRYLRAAQTVNSGTPMILFTASVEHSTVGDGLHGLADMILPKPIRADEFFAALDRLVFSL
ncbi:response regulator [Fertoebacter nigrum]|uniref:Response regulator n=1 Tax=Fertoeibacter niger TaxID=2656921 RepID=A0A8X8KL12_9RHOB|nr:response regulator [Fertoeibacter niger]NUB44824.1 response regulator [Fertoeibacter niger]